MRIFWTTWTATAVMATVLGCGTSHGSDGGTGDCPLPAPTGCMAWGPGDECESVPAQCYSGAWQCETSCDLHDCSGFEPICHVDLGAGCCGEVVAPTCVTPVYSCPAGSIDRTECAAMAPECEATDPCEALAEADCIGDATCAPIYDDFCCPACISTGPCADCSEIAMYRCAPLVEACETDVCGAVDPAHCAGATTTCDGSSPSTGNRCDALGCVAAFEPDGCGGPCPAECVPVTAEICTEECDGLPPDCPADTSPERDGFCFTGRCIAASACIPPDAPTTPPTP